MRQIGSMEASPEEYWRRLPQYMQRIAIEYRDWLYGGVYAKAKASRPRGGPTRPTLATDPRQGSSPDEGRRPADSG